MSSESGPLFLYRGSMLDQEVLVTVWGDAAELAFRTPGGRWGPPIPLVRADEITEGGGDSSP